jgi:hypothetical protein
MASVHYVGLVEVLDVPSDDAVVLDQDGTSADAFLHVPEGPLVTVYNWSWDGIGMREIVSF